MGSKLYEAWLSCCALPIPYLEVHMWCKLFSYRKLAARLDGSGRRTPTPKRWGETNYYVTTISRITIQNKNQLYGLSSVAVKHDEQFKLRLELLFASYRSTYWNEKNKFKLVERSIATIPRIPAEILSDGQSSVVRGEKETSLILARRFRKPKKALSPPRYQRQVQ
jgi:hypothetical protein